MKWTCSEVAGGTASHQGEDLDGEYPSGIQRIPLLAVVLISVLGHLVCPPDVSYQIDPWEPSKLVLKTHPSTRPG